ncbi:MAG TPA: PEPxxWA-CTERM sorting domain-containing protein [Polymorphobacter sp.]|nr:PEPxxWA-CTERM sorting domain-containing protein [Polymorphobacter sp.]
MSKAASTIATALLAAGLFTAMPARAEQEIIALFTPPSQGTYHSYRITAIGGDFNLLFLEGRKIEANYFYDGQGGLMEDWSQLPFYCYTSGSCTAYGMRNAHFTPDSFAFTLNGPPRSFDHCNLALSTWQNYGHMCASYQVITGIWYDAIVNDGTTVRLDDLGGGVVPEPASWALMIAGFGMTGAALRRRRYRTA